MGILCVISKKKLGLTILSPFEGFTEWELELVKTMGTGTPRSCSEGTKKAISRANTGRVTSEVVRERLSRAREKFWDSPEGKEVRNRMSRTLTGKPKSEATKRAMSLGQMGRVHGEEENRRNSESNRRFWESLSEGEKEKRLEESFHSRESRLRCIRALRVKPNTPESLMLGYLEARFPGEWKYNGDFSQGVMIGRKIPDFVNVNGKKEVVEVLGGLGQWHFLEDEAEKIEHYKKFGYKCIVVWEWDCYLVDELDKIFGVKGL